MTHDDAFVISRVTNEAHAVNVANGWWKTRDRVLMLGREEKAIVVIGALGLICSEVGEAMEAVRKHDPMTWADTKTKDTLACELSDIVIRTMDLAGSIGIDLGEAVRVGLERNKGRGHMHGGKAA